MPETSTPDQHGPGALTGAWPAVREQHDAVDVAVHDVPTARVHRPSDLLGAIVATLGVALVMILTTYAQGTTEGVAQDVHNFATLLRNVLVLPVAVLVGFVSFVAPVAVVVELAIRRLWRTILESLAAALGALVLAAAISAAIVEWGSARLVSGMSVRLDGDWTVTIPAFAAAIAALLTATGPRGRRRTVTWSWNLLWVTIGIVVITAQVALPGAVVALLLGRLVGLATRYASGSLSERAYGHSLVAGVRRAGFDPAVLDRVPDTTIGEMQRDSTGTALPAADASSRALTRYSRQRVYALATVDGHRFDVVVLDGDRQVVGILTRLWRSLRLRGIEGRSVVSLRQAAERAALLGYAARAAGVRSPKLLSIAEADDSMLLVQEHLAGAVPLAELSPDRVTDELMQQIWAQLKLAHEAGVAHRALTSDVIMVDEMLGEPIVWLTGWEQGDVASPELARRMDVTSLVALLAVRVGAARALGSAVAVLPDADIASVGPLLQPIALPRRTRDEMRAHKDELANLRSALVERVPEADVEPEKLVRFGARTLITIGVTVIALIVILTTINVDQIASALSGSDWRWSLAGFVFGVLTLPGAALALVAFSPVKLGVWRTTLVQSAATFVALAAPAGIGPAAMNLRMLTKRGVTASLAAATVALVQVVQFVVTVLLLLALSIGSGTQQTSHVQISPLTLVVVGVIVALVAAAMLVPRVRTWVLAKTVPTVRQTWPRLIEILGQPWRIALAVGSNVLHTMGYILAFDASLLALGQSVSLVQVAAVYLIGNTLGSLAPTPGGAGTIEVALTAGLTAIGINPGIAASVAVLFRVLTYWLRIPTGWATMRYLQRVGEI